MEQFDFTKARLNMFDEACFLIPTGFLNELKTITIFRGRDSNYYGAKTTMIAFRFLKYEQHRQEARAIHSRFIDEWIDALINKACHKFPNLKVNQKTLDKFVAAILQEMDKCYLGMQPYAPYLANPNDVFDYSKYIKFEPFVFFCQTKPGHFEINGYALITAMKNDKQNGLVRAESFSTLLAC